MFQVLLVDDEPLARNDIRTLIDFRKHGFEICGEARNGVMALEMIEQSRPQIAIIDVNMPEMNGVELNQMIRKRYPSIKTIMLSSYDDYDYVRDCLKNGSVDYLLKHRLDGTTLLTLLNKAVLELRQEDRLMEDRNAHKEMAERMNPVLIRGYIADLVKGKQDAARHLETYMKKNGLYAEAVSYAAAAVQIVPFLLLTETYSDVQTNRLVQQTVDMMQQSLGDIHEHTAAYVENGRLVVVFGFKERSELAASSEIGRQMSQISHMLGLYLNLKCVYAVGHVCGSLSQLAASYESAERTLDAAAPAAVSPKASGHGKHLSLTLEEQKMLLLSIERLDPEGMHRSIVSIFDSIREQPLHSVAVQRIVSELFLIGEKAMKKGALTDESVLEGLPSRSELGRLGSVRELGLWMQAYYEGLLGSLKSRLTVGTYSRHVSQAVAFILEHYSGGVTLELAASAIGLNPSYLSRIFKEETKATFSEYVNRIRIEAARKLLESGRYSIKQISDQAGFSTHNYFFKVFKEYTGVTPQAYLHGLGGSGMNAKP
ncbi:response regulator [Paenibacillus soyae]|uniref:Response regulator n=1 Tax=Paenibacillus soyae TaxID=2969249 RepID=A0A9X2MST2_9BACL|nr:response regulator [Paenibacillus soyae]MCR2805171.1 response regulator [Paenibacillus soyae]